jgi:rhamnulokinase
VSEATPPAYAAIDLGAESARVITGTFAEGRVVLEQTNRTHNRPVLLPDGLHWDLLGLFAGALHGLHAAQDLRGIGIDAWGVDYALLDDRGRMLGLPYHYRDTRTEGMIQRAAERVPAAELYAATGIQTIPINTVFQLLAEEGSVALEGASRIALIPDIFAYWLSGELANEATSASTTGLLDARDGTWANGVIERLGLPSHIFAPVVEPGTQLGSVRRGYQLAPIPVFAVAGHDTASAFVAAPLERDDVAILSSGTWSLLGVEVHEPVLTEQARSLNLTNERGIDGTTRLLKNVMGLWLVQTCRLALEARGSSLEYEEVVQLADRYEGEISLFDPDDPSLLSAAELDMPHRIGRLCAKGGQVVPESAAALFRSILVSLACKYRIVLEQLEMATGRGVGAIHVIGGGVRNALLCRLTADISGRTVIAGPIEAAALGNVLVQARATGELASLAEMRALVSASFDTVRYDPGADRASADEMYARFLSLLDLGGI